jgi:inner membrane transporter RhtA
VTTSPDRAKVGAAMATASVMSVQFGAALAATLFPLVGPLGAASLRLFGAAAVLVPATRPWRARWTAADARRAVLFGVVMLVMNASIYTAISRLPLATAITLEFLGPLGVAVATATSARQRAWAVPAAVGVALIGGTLHPRDLGGVAAALTAAVAWAFYILLSRKLGRSGPGLSGLCVASVVAAVLMAPIGLVVAGAGLFHPGTAVRGLAVGVLSSAVPYTLDLLALRRLPTAVFGVLTSLNPAVAALAGWLVLSQRLPASQLLGVAAVMMASVGVTLTSRETSRPRAEAEGPTRPPL